MRNAINLLLLASCVAMFAGCASLPPDDLKFHPLTVDEEPWMYWYPWMK